MRRRKARFAIKMNLHSKNSSSPSIQVEEMAA